MFVPTLWSSEIAAIYNQNIVLGNLLAKRIDADVYRMLSRPKGGSYIKFDQIASTYV